MSSTVNVATVELKLPQRSVATKVTSTEPVRPQSLLRAGLAGTVLQDTAPAQLSDAAAPPTLPNHCARAALLAAFPAHSMVSS